MSGQRHHGWGHERGTLRVGGWVGGRLTRTQMEPDNPYVGETEKPGWALLEQLGGLGVEWLL